MEALATSAEHRLARYISEQPPYNLLDRRIENELVPLCQKYGLAILPWSPLAGGILAGRYADGTVPQGSLRRPQRHGQPVRPARDTQERMAAAKRLAELAAAHGLTSSQLALLWVKDQPAITAPIIGPRTLDQLKEHLGVLERSLTSEDSQALDQVVGPGNAVSDFHNSNNWMKARVV